MASSSYNPMASRNGDLSYSKSERLQMSEGGQEHMGGALFAGGYGGSPAGRYMVWFWIVVILVLIAFIFVTLQAFPPQGVTSIDADGNRSVDSVKLFGVSVVVALIIVFIFWIITCFC
jgi:amino acid transporter